MVLFTNSKETDDWSINQIDPSNFSEPFNTGLDNMLWAQMQKELVEQIFSNPNFLDIYCDLQRPFIKNDPKKGRSVILDITFLCECIENWVVD